MELLSDALTTILRDFSWNACHGNNGVWPADQHSVASGQPRPDVLTARPFSLTRTFLTQKVKVRQDAVELRHLKVSLIHLCHLKSQAKAKVGNFSATRARRGCFRVNGQTVAFTRQFREVGTLLEVSGF